eukprot:m.273493 g.273493  ORF g.273493 m.273493 type:complete len:148 (+) comp40576_c0_seq2:718-1161(+)
MADNPLDTTVRKEKSLLHTVAAQRLVGANYRAKMVMAKAMSVHAKEHHREKRAAVLLEKKLVDNMTRIRKISLPAKSLPSLVDELSDGEERRRSSPDLVVKDYPRKVIGCDTGPVFGERSPSAPLHAPYRRLMSAEERSEEGIGQTD